MNSTKGFDEDVTATLRLERDNSEDRTSTVGQGRPTRLWLAYAFTAACLFVIYYTLLARLSAAAGFLSVFYLSGGSIFWSLCFHLYKSFGNWRNSGHFWNDQNLIKGGKLAVRNLLGLLVYAMTMLVAIYITFASIHFAVKAQINPGVVSTIWSIDPIIMAVADYVWFGQKLQYYHHVGIVSIVACSIVLSLSDFIDADSPSTQVLEPGM